MGHHITTGRWDDGDDGTSHHVMTGRHDGTSRPHHDGTSHDGMGTTGRWDDGDDGTSHHHPREVRAVRPRQRADCPSKPPHILFVTGNINRRTTRLFVSWKQKQKQVHPGGSSFFEECVPIIYLLSAMGWGHHIRIAKKALRPLTRCPPPAGSLTPSLRGPCSGPGPVAGPFPRCAGTRG